MPLWAWLLVYLVTGIIVLWIAHAVEPKVGLGQPGSGQGAIIFIAFWPFVMLIVGLTLLQFLLPKSK